MKFYDNKGVEIREFAVIKFYHFTGKRRRKYYMYKWVNIIDGHLAARHLTPDGGSFWLKAVADKDNRINCEVVQDYGTLYQEY